MNAHICRSQLGRSCRESGVLVRAGACPQAEVAGNGVAVWLIVKGFSAPALASVSAMGEGAA